MKKILLFKRAAALCIDIIVIAFVFHSIFGIDLSKYHRKLVFLLVLTPILLRDVVFFKRSIGKRIFGLYIFDSNWEKPQFSLLIKRGVLSYLIGIIKVSVAFRVTADYIHFFDWERDKLKAIVIEKNVYRRLKEQATENGYFDPKKMTFLYNEYLMQMFT